ncbi:MAG: SDR family oxidoreductase [Pseudomonadota bacterium]|nr:SDR family oxidoreductase [Pseudomonadota bacterium]
MAANGNRLNGKAGLITAAGSGMGRAGATMFAAEGARVAVCDHDAAAVEAATAAIREAGGEALPLVADLSDLAAARRVADQAAEAFGRLDFVWNHLGHPGPGAVEQVDEGLLALAIDLNLRSVMATTDAAIPHLRAAGGGAFLFTASTAGLVGSRYSPVYSAMKHGVVGFAKALALKLAPDGIRSNAVCPGPIETPMMVQFGNRPDLPNRPEEEVRAAAGAVTPMRRVGRPEEVAAAALFLISDDASYITGAALPVDGGFTAG